MMATLLSQAESSAQAGQLDKALTLVCQAYAAGGVASFADRLEVLLWQCLDALLEPPLPDRVQAIVARLRPVLPPDLLCHVLITLGSRIGNRLKNYAADLELQQEALGVAEASGRPLDVLRALSAIVFCQIELQRYSEAEQGCQRGLALAEHAENAGYLAAFIERRGNVLLRSGCHAEAVRFLHGARDEAVAHDFLAIGAKIGALLAEVHADRGDVEDAARSADEAMESARQCGPRVEAEVVTRVSGLITRLEDWRRLDGLLTRALELDEWLSVQDQANNRHNLASARSNLGDVSSAVRLEQEALARYESIGYAMGVDVARTHLAAYQQAAGVRSPLHDLHRANPLAAAAMQNDLSPQREAAADDAWLRHLQQQGLLEGAAPKKVAAAVQVAPAQPQADDAYLDSLLKFCAQFGYKYADLLNREAGIAAYVPEEVGLRHAVRLLEGRRRTNRFDSVQQALQALWLLGTLYERLKEFESAHAIFEETAQLAQAHEAPWPELAARRQRARLHLTQRRFQPALAEHERIGRLLVAARRQTAWEARGRRLFLDANFGFVEEMIEAACQAGAAEAALLMLERYRSQSFLDSLQVQQPLAPAVRRQAEQLQQQILTLQDRLINSRLVQTTEIDGLRHELAELRQRRDLLLAEAGGAQARSAAAAKPMNRGELRALLKDGRFAIAYFVGEHALYAIGISAAASWIVKRELPCGDLEGLIEQCRRGWEGGGARRDIALQPRPSAAPPTVSAANPAATRLAKLLLEGVADKIPTGAAVIVVPHRAVCLVPFDAMPVPDSDRLLAENWTISYTPSLTSLHRSGLRGAAGRGACVAGVGRFPALVDSPLRFAHLPNVRPEVETVGRLFKSAALLDAECTAAILRERLPGARFIHLATHGYADPEDPLLSSLVLGDGSFFKAAEVAGLRLTADCVVLSACQTALGAMSRGEGILGLAQSFLLAGARTLLASLWCVNDRSTALLFGQFYKSLASRHSRAEALRLAKEFVRNYAEADSSGQRSRPFADPFYWAPFVLLGHPGGLSTSGATS